MNCPWGNCGVQDDFWYWLEEEMEINTSNIFPLAWDNIIVGVVFTN